jgi:glycosyltransferase involved in cell wall biosynthesis
MTAHRAANVLLLQASPEFGGSRKSLLSLIEALREGNYSPAVACSGPGWVTEQLNRRSVPWIQLPFFAWRKWLERFRVSPSIRRDWMAALRPRDVRLIHSNEFWWAPHAILAARLLSIPSAVHLRDGHHTLKKARQYRLTQANAIIAVSSELRQQFAADPVLFAKTEVIFNAHDELTESSQRSRDESRARFGVVPGQFVIGNVGILCERKNQLLLINAAAELKGRRKIGPFKVLIAGDGEPNYSRLLQQTVDRLDVNKEVALVGPVSDMGAFYSAADVVVHCARREGLPRVIPEAMLARKPVIATAAEGVRDAIPDQRFGLVTAQEDVTAIADHVTQLVTNPDLRQQIAEQAHRRAQALFTFSAHREKMLDLYERLLNPPLSSSRS